MSVGEKICRILICYILLISSAYAQCAKPEIVQAVAYQNDEPQSNFSNVFSQTVQCDEIMIIPGKNFPGKPTLQQRLNICEKVYIPVPKNISQIQLWVHLINYLKELGLNVVEVPVNYFIENNNKDYNSETEGGTVIYTHYDETDFFYGAINDLGVVMDLFQSSGVRADVRVNITFIDFYNSHSWNISFTNPFSYRKFNNRLLEHIGNRKFDPESQISGRKMKTCYNEQLLKNEYLAKGINHVEGIYENITLGESKYKLGLKEINGNLYLIYLSGASNREDWEVGEIKAVLFPIATPYLFKSAWIMSDKKENFDSYLSFREGFMEVWVSENKSSYLKIYPTINENVNFNVCRATSGTGFAIGSAGLIVTNNHVIENTRKIKVRGVNGDFNKSYTAEPLLVDANNDLAIIKITDLSFTGLGTIPYGIKSKTSNVGENVYVLGYPLRASMGEEVKLTNGIVSSKTGYQGDVTSYQISAPIQSGNSGGPLFDNSGHLIGIINAKHANAENVSYAIKSSFLLNMMDLLDYPSNQGSTSLSKQTLSQQVSLIKNFVYIIDTE